MIQKANYIFIKAIGFYTTLIKVFYIDTKDTIQVNNDKNIKFLT